MDMIATKTPAIDKAARIFHFIAGKGSATYSEIHQNVGLPQSTTSALLARLEKILSLLQKENEILLIEKDINENPKSVMDYLKEILNNEKDRTIKKENKKKRH